MRWFLTLLAAPLSVAAQSSLPTEFPVDAIALPAVSLSERISGKVFTVKPADGTSWRLEYKANGYAFIDTSSGFRDSGKWRVDGTRLCADWQRAPSGCSEARLKDETVYIKRVSNGEVVTLVSQ